MKLKNLFLAFFSSLSVYSILKEWFYEFEDLSHPEYEKNIIKDPEPRIFDPSRPELRGGIR